ncbi:division/cell wall cluster transcriptional repressor MraZ [Rhodosalinus halophilus]|uniref:division/cell wall cluster transcriptional repressor MraZ n=1 Tax=Rhodosalinus halophilus TaxID=2259333 RepID=UPI0018F2977A|nr:cell division/cell wall cluster transcriptional repressor MraZ [Rhodosalinus halophilus]
MSLTFRGESRHKVDAKGRVSIPAGFRRVLQAGDPDWSPGQAPRVSIAYGDPRGRRLQCFTVAGIERIARAIQRLPRGSDERKRATRLYSTKVYDTTLDDNGRIVLSEALRNEFGIEGEALFVAEVDHFQIWAPGNYADEQAEVDALLDDMGEDEDPLAFLDDLPDLEG